MALDTLPVLPEDHPLYDWTDWQSSRDALVSGTPTKYFAKEAWNAIVDDLNEALTAAGLEWDSTYTAAEGAKITVAYGKLTATKFNSVRHNIEWPAPLGWAWAWNEDFRGYVGREDFRGRTTYGKKCDLVYPEYIIELVRKLNLLLELMRGTALIAESDAPYLSTVSVQPNVLSRPAAHVVVEHNATINQDVGLRIRLGARVETNQKIFTNREVNGQVDIAAAANVHYNIEVPIDASGRSREKIVTEPREVLIPAKVYAQMEHNKVLETDGNTLTEVETLAEALINQSISTDAQIDRISKVQSEAVSREPVAAESTKKTYSVIESTVQQSQGISGIARKLTKTRIAANMDPATYAEVVVQSACGINSSGYLDTAWLPPIWVNGGLWIRQVNNVPVQRVDGSLEVA